MTGFYKYDREQGGFFSRAFDALKKMLRNN